MSGHPARNFFIPFRHIVWRQYLTVKTRACNQLIIKMIPFGFQKTAYWSLKGGISAPKRASFRSRKMMYWKTGLKFSVC